MVKYVGKATNVWALRKKAAKLLIIASKCNLTNNQTKYLTNF